MSVFAAHPELVEQTCEQGKVLYDLRRYPDAEKTLRQQRSAAIPITGNHMFTCRWPWCASRLAPNPDLRKRKPPWMKPGAQ
jgi:hypothetical protein